MSSKLTKTEELAAKLYFNEGLKPKEIAQKLGISVNTVYKAISKYRAFVKNLDQPLPQSGNEQPSNDSLQLTDNNYSLNAYSVFNVKLSIITNSPLPVISNSEPNDTIDKSEVVKELRGLRELLGKLIAKVEELEKRGSCVPSTGSNHEKEDDYSYNEPINSTAQNNYLLPDFIRDNPWVDVIKSIHSTAESS
ncbi:helix-turn-helix domain-containing protein [Vulcanisaeta souniana]|uniref:LuxR family transcriptional regulator n=1 Tax=Vulcanisaeta souniana JCM 11219 TaxID=1293586 RepID=A0A830E190_9CREN|nr:helix-turn-helix domain-containing protein [Vulcanisaeta souniana]BDR91351.1 LuxR family transcriptional regulator [Vulcanisaeta souniana JCM 11219]GGI72549.1 LuxR family transcriptional regulator [Vulcanisaeta souniana JCM 11219]